MGNNFNDEVISKYPPQFLVSSFDHALNDPKQSMFFEYMAQDFAFFVSMSLLVSDFANVDDHKRFKKEVIRKWEAAFLKKNQIVLSQISKLHNAYPEYADQFPSIDIEDYNKNVREALSSFKKNFISSLEQQMMDDDTD